MKIYRQQKAIPNYGFNYDDLPPVPVVAARLGSSAPTLRTFVGNIQQYTFDATNDFIIGATEITHGYEEASDILAHIHWATRGTDGTDRAVKWQLEYTISDIDSDFDSSVLISAEEVIPADTDDRTHFVTDIGTITGTGIAIGTYICWRFNRIAADGTAPSNDPFGLAVGFHVKQNSLGSRQVYIK